MRENALEEIGRLPERDRALGFVRGAKTCDDGLVGPAGSEEMAGDGDALPSSAMSASAAREWIRCRFGRTVSLAIASWVRAWRQL